MRERPSPPRARRPRRGASTVRVFGFSAFAVLAAPIPASSDTWLPSGDAADRDVGAFACRPVEDALRAVSTETGLPIVWSEDLVPPDALVPPGVRRTRDDEVFLEALLAPSGLRIDATEDGVVRVVPIDPSSAKDRGGATEGGATLAAWVDATSAPTRWAIVPGTAVAELVAPTSDLLVLDVSDPEGDRDPEAWRSLAFELKTRIVEEASSRSGLRVAAAGPPATVERLVAFGLAPYVDAYLHSGTPFRPSIDPTARTWFEAPSGGRALDHLVEAARRGDELVVFSGAPLTPPTRDLLRLLGDLGATEASRSSGLEGVAPERFRFLAEPGTGALLLVLEVGSDVIEGELSVGGLDRVEEVAPEELRFQVTQTTAGARLRVSEGPEVAVLRLRRFVTSGTRREIDVSDSEIVDPWEQVVRNQVFQDRQRRRFRSLDVMEYIRRTPQWAGAERIDWTHRILQRRGRLTEYLHLGYSINGVPAPEDRLLMGRLFRTEANIQLRPLELELDETYRYDFEGIERIDGRDTYRIAFEPLRDGSLEDGSLVSGTVWIDRRTAAHRRIRLVQEGLDGRLVQRVTTTEYEWIPDDRECFWDWRRRAGTSTTTFGGELRSTRDETLREDFDYNRPDIDELVRRAHESDVMIHVETPPHGHRWLVRTDKGRQPREWEAYPEDGVEVEEEPARVPAAPPAAAEPGDRSSEEGEGEAEDLEWSSRVLAGVHAFSRRARFDLGGFGSRRGEEVELFPGIVLSDDDFLHRGQQVVLGLFVDRGLVSWSTPALGGRRAVFGLTLDVPFESEPLPGPPHDGGFVDFRVRQPEVRADLTVPWSRGFSTRIALAGRALQIRPSGLGGDFVEPLDTSETVAFVDLDHRAGRFRSSIGLELGSRSDWRPWGFEGAEEVQTDWTVVRGAFGVYGRAGASGSWAAELVASFGSDLDVFSRQPFGRARETVVGFGSGRGFDEGTFLSLTWATSIRKRLPLTLQVETGTQRIGSEPSVDRLGASVRFLIRGPFRIDLWPIVGYGIASSLVGEAGNTSFGLVLQRRR